MKPAARIVLKIFELITSTACLVAKGITDLEEGRIFQLNQKLSREWSLLNNVTWSPSGNTFANITYGGYTIIIALMTLTRCIDARSRPTLLEKILLVLGVLMFLATGGMILGSLEQIMPDLYDNAIILGVLSFIAVVLFLIDLSDPLGRRSTSETSQTQTVVDSSTWQRQSIPKVNQEAQTEPKSVEHTTERRASYQQAIQAEPNTFEVDYVRTESLPRHQSPVFAKVKAPIEARKTKHEYGRGYLNRSYTEPWEEVSSPRLISSTNPNTYVKAPPVDRGSFVIRKQRPVLYTYYPEETIQEESEESHQVRKGYVANAARMWDNRIARSKSPPSDDGLNTMV